MEFLQKFFAIMVVSLTNGCPMEHPIGHRHGQWVFDCQQQTERESITVHFGINLWWCCILTTESLVDTSQWQIYDYWKMWDISHSQKVTVNI